LETAAFRCVIIQVGKCGWRRVCNSEGFQGVRKILGTQVWACAGEECVEFLQFTETRRVSQNQVGEPLRVPREGGLLCP
jgi:hypothetical protein